MALLLPASLEELKSSGSSLAANYYFYNTRPRHFRIEERAFHDMRDTTSTVLLGFSAD